MKLNLTERNIFVLRKYLIQEEKAQLPQNFWEEEALKLIDDWNVMFDKIEELYKTFGVIISVHSDLQKKLEETQKERDLMHAKLNATENAYVDLKLEGRKKENGK